MRLDRITLAHDFSEEAFDALSEACLLARTFGGRITLVHAVPEAPTSSQDFQAVKTRALELFEDLQSSHADVQFAEPVVESADPARLVLATAAEQNADMIVIGSGEKTKLDRVLLGSSAELIVRESSRPVWLVRPGRVHREVRHMICAVDASDPAKVALSAAAFLSRTFVSKLTLLSVAKPGERAAQSEKLQKAAAELDLHGIEVAQVVREGKPIAELVAAVTDLAADLLVLGSAGRQGLSRLFHANTAESVIRLAPCSILTTRLPRE